ncbi:hypothetical protein ACOMHN_059604 [Nucella lapillus]
MAKSRSLIDKRFELLNACCEKTWEQVKPLLTDMDLNFTDPNLHNVIHYTCKNGNYRVADNILKNQDEETKELLLTMQAKNNETPLFMAVDRGYTKLVEVLIKHGAPLAGELYTMRGMYPLHIASKCGHDFILNLIFSQQDVDVDIRNPFTDETPLHLAVTYVHENAVTILLANQASVNSPDSKGYTPLHRALGQNLAIIRRILERNPDLEALDRAGHTALLRACFMKSDEKVIRLLLAHGADPNIANFDGITPLHFVCQDTDLDLIETLLAAGARVNVAAIHGMTPLCVACHLGHADVVRLLLRHHAKIYVVGGLDPVSLARRKKHEPIARMLTDYLINRTTLQVASLGLQQFASAPAPTVSCMAQLASAPASTGSSVAQLASAPAPTGSSVAQPATAPAPAGSSGAQPASATAPTVSCMAQLASAPAPAGSSVARAVSAPAHAGSSVAQPATTPAPALSSVAQPATAPAPALSSVAQPATAPAPALSSVAQPATAPAPALSSVAQPATAPATAGSSVAQPASGPATAGSSVAQPATAPAPALSSVAQPATAPATAGSSVAQPATAPAPALSSVAQPATAPAPAGSIVAQPATAPAPAGSIVAQPATAPAPAGSNGQKPTRKMD